MIAAEFKAFGQNVIGIFAAGAVATGLFVFTSHDVFAAKQDVASATSQINTLMVTFPFFLLLRRNNTGSAPGNRVVVLAGTRAAKLERHEQQGTGRIPECVQREGSQAEKRRASRQIRPWRNRGNWLLRRRRYHVRRLWRCKTSCAQ